MCFAAGSHMGFYIDSNGRSRAQRRFNWHACRSKHKFAHFGQLWNHRRNARAGQSRAILVRCFLCLPLASLCQIITGPSYFYLNEIVEALHCECDLCHAYVHVRGVVVVAAV
jgi:hypothetical protein